MVENLVFCVDRSSCFACIMKILISAVAEESRLDIFDENEPCCLLKKTLVITTNLTNPESVSGIICLTKGTCIAIKLLVQLSLRVQKKN